jgi:flagellar FliL protein
MAPKAPATPDPAAKPAAADGAQEEAPKKKRSKLPILIVAVVLLAGLGAGGWFLAPRFLGGATAAPEEAHAEEPIHAVVPLGSIVVNVNNPDARRYVKVGVELGVPTEAAAKEVEKHKPQLLDLLVTVFSTAELETLESGSGRAELKEELLSRIKDELGLAKVARVYFTEFLIQ